jgi:hypothetical protein
VVQRAVVNGGGAHLMGATTYAVKAVCFTCTAIFAVGKVVPPSDDSDVGDVGMSAQRVLHVGNRDHESAADPARARARLSANALAAVASLTYAAALAAVGLSRNLGLTIVVLLGRCGLACRSTR